MANSDVYVPWPGWQLTGILGHGSFGKVYKIEKICADEAQNAKAAMKVISIDTDMLDDMFGSQYDENSARKLCEESLSAIRKEYDLMYELRDNPNIVRCDEMKVVGHRDGIGCDVYIMMELLTPLQKIWKFDEVSEKEVLKLGEDICRALNACEQHSIIHRDIKPQNILVTDTGNYKLGDFGTARTFERTSSATMAGTETYMAPEIIKREKYGRDVDTYSLGLVMYRMLNKGQLPFLQEGRIPTAEERERSLQRRISGEDLPAPATGSNELKAVVLKACSFDRNNRYKSALQMLEDLSRAGEGTLPWLWNEESESKTVVDSDETNSKGKIASKDQGEGEDKDPEGSKHNDTKKGKKKHSFIIALAVAILCIAGGLVLLTNNNGASTEEATDTLTETETGTVSETSSSDTGKNIPYTEGEDSMAWIQYEMWDSPSKGSDGDNSDPHHYNFWTVYYDRDTKCYRKIVEEQWFDMEAYSEDDVKGYADRLTYNYSDEEYDFININYVGGVTGNYGNLYVLKIEYNNVDDSTNKSNAQDIFMNAEWGPSIDEAENVILAIGGVKYRASIASEDEALNWATYFANISVGSGLSLLSTGTSNDSVGNTVYQIKVGEDQDDRFVTYENWNVNSFGEITDLDTGSEVNPLKYTE